ncbi:hypothetical protein [Planosporangium flavigriseum]|uniref:Uncharacterized protein n=1 Tax=Planosporangium flavigriseum TaxID=373681 RepID=A0A8J3LPQ2_9ACTN|nr:hypothetical protein [Planosporangium flavigriseum]GIG75622.1 hypothetical protein Pfl04_40260 [Planosporangium flavigriseum]
MTQERDPRAEENQERERRRHGIPEEPKVTPATTADMEVEPAPNTALAEALATSDIITEDDGSGLGGGSSGSSSGGSGFEGHPDWKDPDVAPKPKELPDPDGRDEPDEAPQPVWTQQPGKGPR